MTLIPQVKSLFLYTSGKREIFSPAECPKWFGIRALNQTKHESYTQFARIPQWYEGYDTMAQYLGSWLWDYTESSVECISKISIFLQLTSTWSIAFRKRMSINTRQLWLWTNHKQHGSIFTILCFSTPCSPPQVILLTSPSSLISPRLFVCVCVSHVSLLSELPLQSVERRPESCGKSSLKAAAVGVCVCVCCGVPLFSISSPLLLTHSFAHFPVIPYSGFGAGPHGAGISPGSGIHMGHTPDQSSAPVYFTLKC